MSKKIIMDGIEFDESDLDIKKFDVADYLNDDEQIEIFLNSAFESGDLFRIMRAFNTVARANGGIANLAKNAGVGRESLYRTLSGKTKPYFETVLKLAEANGFVLSLKPINAQIER